MIPHYEYFLPVLRRFDGKCIRRWPGLTAGRLSAETHSVRLDLLIGVFYVLTSVCFDCLAPDIGPAGEFCGYDSMKIWA